VAANDVPLADKWSADSDEVRLISLYIILHMQMSSGIGIFSCWVHPRSGLAVTSFLPLSLQQVPDTYIPVLEDGRFFAKMKDLQFQF
jgi:hypothetical protein